MASSDDRRTSGRPRGPVNGALSSDSSCSSMRQWTRGSVPEQARSCTLRGCRNGRRPENSPCDANGAGTKGRAPLRKLSSASESKQQAAVRPVSCRPPWSHLPVPCHRVVARKSRTTADWFAQGARTSCVRCDKLLSLTGDAPELSVGNGRGRAPTAAGPPGQSPPALGWFAPPALRDDEAPCAESVPHF